MNYMKEVAHILGVDLHERFKIDAIDAPQFCDTEFLFDDDEGLCMRKREGIYLWHRVTDNTILTNLLTGTYNIIEEPYVPNRHDVYWYVNTDGEVRTYKFLRDITDIGCLALGNCFATKQQAIKHRDEVLQKMQEVYPIDTADKEEV